MRNEADRDDHSGLESFALAPLLFLVTLGVPGVTVLCLPFFSVVHENPVPRANR